MVTIRELSHVVELLDRYAEAQIVDAALEHAGLTRSVLSLKTSYAPYATEGILIEAVARAIGDRHLGARLGRDFNYLAYGAYATYVLGAPNLETALERGRRALVLTHPGSAILFRKTAKHVVVGRDSSGLTVTGSRHLDEGSLAVIRTVARHYLGQDWVPDWVELPAGSRGGVAALQEILEAPVLIRDGTPGIAIRLTSLAALNPDATQLRGNITLKELAELMDVSPVQTVTDAVEQILQITFLNSDMSEQVVARHLAIGSRTLQRALHKEGTSFRAIRSGFAEVMARHLVSQTDTPIDKISRMLSYKDDRSFRRAFKGWTGLSPTRFRRETR